MPYKQSAAPAVEPLTIGELKTHLRLDSGTLANNLSSTQSIAPGSHVIAAAYTLVGSWVEVLGYPSLVLLEAGTFGAGGTVDVKIQHSDDQSEVEDWTGGAFTQVTTANDNATFEKQYTGAKRYIRTVATVAGNACEFGTSVVKNAPTSTEDDLLTDLIEKSRRACENFQGMAYITQEWELWLDAFPDEDHIDIPLPPLQSVEAIKYYGTDNTEYTMTASDYFVDTVTQPGRVVLAYGKIWPTTTLRPANAVVVEFTAGYGDAASDVPKEIKQAIVIESKLDYLDFTPEERQQWERARNRLLWQSRIVGF